MSANPSPTFDGEPTRAQIDALAGTTLLEFGTSWCGHCRAAQPAIAAALKAHEGVKHLKVEDGSGRKLGRTFAVKLWPTLIVLRNGQEVTRVVRPHDETAVADALARAATP